MDSLSDIALFLRVLDAGSISAADEKYFLDSLQISGFAL